jgi:hypothetical protein
VEGATIAKILSRLGGVYDEKKDDENAISNYEEAIRVFDKELPPLDQSLLSQTETEANCASSIWMWPMYTSI